jgi:hypothetical protein
VLYACDLAWWNSESGQKALREFKGEKWTQCPDAAREYNLDWIRSERGEGIGHGYVYTGGGNSGYQAINLAAQWGAAEIFMCGFTMGAVDDPKRTHWHPNHKGNNPSVSQLFAWGNIMGQLPRYLPNRLKLYGRSSIENIPKMTELVPKCQGVIGVSRSGGWVTPDYPERLYKATGATILTDMALPFKTVPLQHDWPGWWAKMEIFRPDIKGDWLYMDMDTIVTGDIKPLLNVGKLALLGDYYRDILETGVMYLPEWARRMVWNRWIEAPNLWMKTYNGDGHFIRETIGALALDLRKIVDGLHSYKVDGLRPDTRLLIYHGQPRPHMTEHWQ